MKKSNLLVALLILLALVAVGGILFAKKKPADQSIQYTTSTPTQKSGTPSQDSSQAPATGAINITNNMFTPPQINVQVGGTVTWTNNDKVAHTVTADLDNGNGPASGEIQPGQTYSYTFKKAGSVQYHCKIHPSMRGTIVVK